MTVNRAGDPVFASSSRPSPSASRRPIDWSSARAAAGSCGVCSASREYHFLLAGVSGPNTGRPAPRNTVSAKSLRSTAIEIARRSSSRWSHPARGSPANAPGLRFSQNASGSRPTPRSYRRSLPSSAARLTVAYASAGTSLIVESLAPDVEAQQLRVFLGDDFEHQLVEIRQLDALVVLPPVVRVAREHQPLARAVRAQHERPEAGDVPRRRRQAPSLLRACRS